jgi:hypothetical protein
MSAGLLAWPAQAAFQRVIPKSKILGQVRASRSLRQRFTDEVEQIVWQYKLSPETINLPAREGVGEIQVFGIGLRTKELSEPVLRAIDKAIPFPLVYELSFEDCLKPVVAYKRPSEADYSKWVIEQYFEGDWVTGDSAREPLPVALNLALLYENIVRSYCRLTALPGESLAAQVRRIQTIEIKRTEYQKLKTRLAQEPQFNRKVELNRQLREVKQQLTALMGEPRIKEREEWTN